VPGGGTTAPGTTAPISANTTAPTQQIKIPSVMSVPVGGAISWTLHGFGNNTGAPLTSLSIVDMPGVGLNLASGNLPAFHNGAGVTYDIHYRVAGSSTWRTLATGVNAAIPFTFNLPQNGTIHYTEIRFDFGPVPVNFAQGNTITLNFIAGNAPNNTLINHFIVMRGNNQTPGLSPYTPIVASPPTPGPGNTLAPNANGNGFIELDNNNVSQGAWEWRESNGWAFVPNPNQSVSLGAIPQTGVQSITLVLASVINLTIIIGLGVLIKCKINKRKVGGQ